MRNVTQKGRCFWYFEIFVQVSSLLLTQTGLYKFSPDFSILMSDAVLCKNIQSTHFQIYSQISLNTVIHYGARTLDRISLVTPIMKVERNMLLQEIDVTFFKFLWRVHI